MEKKTQSALGCRQGILEPDAAYTKAHCCVTMSTYGWQRKRKGKKNPKREEEREPWSGDLLTRILPLFPPIHRFKPEMWAKVAEEMQVPWRAAEAMHWQLGEADMARRAGVVPFSLTSSSSTSTSAANAQSDPSGVSSSRASPSRGHVHSQSQGSVPRSDPHMLARYPPRGPPPPHLAHHPLAIPPPLPAIPPRGSSLPPRRESMPPRPTTSDFLYETGPAPGPGLPPIQRATGGGERMQLPSVSELTTGVSPYSTPAFSLGGVSASPSATASPRTSALPVPPLNYSPDGTPGGSKRGRDSPGTGREAIRRRH